MKRLALPERFRRYLDALPPDCEVTWYSDPRESEHAIEGAEVLWHDQVTAAPLGDLVVGAKRLTWVFIHNVGVDHVPLEVLATRGIPLFNGAGLYAIPIAEYAVMAMLGAAKGFRQLMQAQDRAEWLSLPPAFGELFATSALIIGYGHIGEAIRQRLDAFGVDTVGVRRTPDARPLLGPTEWRARLSEFDWVIVTAPLTTETDHLIGRAELAAMKASAWLVNVSRGRVVDMGALVAALESNTIGGAYLDVTDPEPLPAGSSLWNLPNVIITPHSSFASRRFEQRAAALFLETLARFEAGQPSGNRVDLEAGY